MKRMLIGVVIAAIAVAGIGRVVSGGVTPHLYSGTILQDSSQAPTMDEMYYAGDKPVALSDFDDSLVMIYFGYSHCPDVCPTALASAATAIDALDADDQDRVELLMISVDPERDSPEDLQEYVQFFRPSFRGATGSVEAIARLASQYGVYYEAGEGTVESGYVVDHTATMMAIDTKGALRIVWPPNITPQQLSDDLKELLTR